MQKKSNNIKVWKYDDVPGRKAYFRGYKFYYIENEKHFVSTNGVYLTYAEAERAAKKLIVKK